MKIAIAGYGSLAEIYICAIREIDGLDISSIYDVDIEKVKKKIKGIKIDKEYDELLSSECDVVLLCVPVPFQVDMAKRAADSGKNVILQIPPAKDYEQLAELAEYFQVRELCLIPAMYDRYFGNLKDVREHLEKNTIGNIGVFNIRRYCPMADNPEHMWYNDPALSGGCLYQLTVCDIDIVRQLLGEVKTAFGYHRTMDGIDYAVLTLTMECGILVNIESMYGYHGEFCKSYELSGSKGNILFDSLAANSSKISGMAAKSKPFNIDCSLNGAYHNPYKLMFLDIAHRLKEKDDTICNIDDLLKAYKIADACRQKASGEVQQLWTK